MDARLSNNTVEQRADVASAVESRLVAAKRLPAQIAIRAAEINQRLTEQQRPKTELQRILWQQVAHRASGIESWDACEESILRVGGCNAVRINAATVVPGSGSNDQPQETSADDYLVASISSEHIEKLNRNRRQQQHGLFRALAFIDTLTTKNEKEPFAKLELPDIRRHFPDRMTCEQYLISSQVVDQWRCPHCGDGPKRCWLKGRRRWECGHCGSQHGLRQGTIWSIPHFRSRSGSGQSCWSAPAWTYPQPVLQMQLRSRGSRQRDACCQRSCWHCNHRIEIGC